MLLPEIEGKNLGAMYFLVDNFIKANAEQELFWILKVR
jgi:hypothetical protein